MHTIRRRLASTLLGALVVGALVPGAAFAASGRTVYVDDTGVAKAAAKGKCESPNYNTIQEAVNDTSASRVVVCAGTYVEQVTVERDLSLEGRKGAVIQAPAGELDAIVLFRGPQKSQIQGFTITGAGSTTVNAGVRASGFVGDDVAYGPTNVTVKNNHISDILDTRYGNTDGKGIFIYQAQGKVTNNTVERYGLAGISADGSERADTSAKIENNTITGQGTGGSYGTQVGIRLDETQATARHNTISGNYGSGVDGIGYGIEVIFATSTLRDNSVTNNQIGVHLGPGSGAQVRGNVVSNNAGNGIELLSTTAAKLLDNKASDNGSNGIYLAAGATGNTLQNNKAHGNASVDIFDANGAPLVNTYNSNDCDTSNPAGLCS